jgi:7,8-dihydro-6-hydroxymethylpterin dimethyltransferase
MTPLGQANGRGALLEVTQSICPVCRRSLGAELREREGRVVLEKRCALHNAFESLVFGDARRYAEIQRYSKPGDRPLELQTEVSAGCPYDCGICPEHKQHSCLGIIEVNTACNLDCPICFAESGTGPAHAGAGGFSLSLGQVEGMLDAFVAAEGEPEAVQFSGGEPSIHREILPILAAARKRGIKLVMLNTNGIRLARERRFAPALAELGVHVYLQFDGFKDSTNLAIRGRRLQAEKLRALDACAEAGLGVSLAAAVERGVNEDELGEIVRFGVEHPAVTGVFFQPVTHSGRFLDFDPLERLTNAEVIRGVAQQLPEWFREDDFVPVPCCSPTCRSATFALYDGSDLVPLPRLVDVDDYLDYVTNRAVPDLQVKEALEGLFSASAAGGTERTGERLECVACGVGLPLELRDAAAKGFMVVTQDFQDPYTLDVRKLQKCCVAEIVPDGRLIPFCAYNSVGYREQVRAELSGGAQ